MIDYERNADASKTLSDKWKKGELPSGWYWVEGSRAQGIYAYTAEYLNTMYRPKNSERIIEQMPSYEEWKASYNCMLENEVLRLKNAQLKELLKECRLSINGYPPYDSGEDILKLTYRINQALGEDK